MHDTKMESSDEAAERSEEGPMADFPIHRLQALINGISAEHQKQRATTQMTLGALIDALAAIPGDTPVTGFGRPMSYRGYYEDIAFRPSDEVRPAAELLRVLRDECMGQVFEGYKGGDYTMGRNTPLWIAPYGDCGDRIVGLDTAGVPVKPITSPDED